MVARSIRRSLFRVALPAIALTLSLSWPLAGDATLLIPIGGATLATVLRHARLTATRIDAAGPVGGSLVVRGGTASAVDWLARGILPIAWRPAACGSAA